MERLLLILLKMFPSWGPKKTSATKTTSATKDNINAYSIKPWALSLTTCNNLVTSFHF